MPDEPQAPSEEFIRASIHACSNTIECQFCGRVYFSQDGFDFEEGELEELLKLSKQEPDKCIELDYEPNWGILDGKQYVADCKCNAASKYEKLFWDSRYLIEKYFTAMARAQQQKANDTTNLSRQISSAIS